MHTVLLNAVENSDTRFRYFDEYESTNLQFIRILETNLESLVKLVFPDAYQAINVLRQKTDSFVSCIQLDLPHSN